MPGFRITDTTLLNVHNPSVYVSAGEIYSHEQQFFLSTYRVTLNSSQQSSLDNLKSYILYFFNYSILDITIDYRNFITHTTFFRKNRRNDSVGSLLIPVISYNNRVNTFVPSINIVRFTAINNEILINDIYAIEADVTNTDNTDITCSILATDATDSNVGLLLQVADRSVSSLKKQFFCILDYNSILNHMIFSNALVNNYSYVGIEYGPLMYQTFEKIYVIGSTPQPVSIISLLHLVNSQNSMNFNILSVMQEIAKQNFSSILSVPQTTSEIQNSVIYVQDSEYTVMLKVKKLSPDIDYSFQETNLSIYTATSPVYASYTTTIADQDINDTIIQLEKHFEQNVSYI